MSETVYLQVPIKNIITQPGRARKDFGKLQQLAESIKANGLINPIYVTNSDKEGIYLLSAGERRYRASVLAGLTMIPISFRDKLSLLQNKIVELEENIGRKELDWQEEAELHRQIDELKRTENPNWTQKETAQLVQVSPGMASIQIDIAKKLKADPTLREEVRNLDINSARKVIENREQVRKVERLQEQGKLKITTDLLFGSCVDLIKTLPDKSIDLVVTDPPYGLEALEDLRDGTGTVMPGHATMSKDHNQDLTSVLKLLSALGPELARVMKPGAHFYCFTAFQYIGDFIRALSPLEFQPPVLVWDRGRNTTPGYGYNYLNRLEAIIYGHNPPRGRRLAKNMYNVLEHPTVPNALRVYPTEKPQSLLKVLIGQSSNLNDLVLDPFAGSGSTLKASRSLGRRSLGFEVNEDAWKRAQLHMSESPQGPELFDKEGK